METPPPQPPEGQQPSDPGQPYQPIPPQPGPAGPVPPTGPAGPGASTPLPNAGPGYAAYPRPAAGPTIRFDVIGEAFKLVFADLGTWAVAALMLAIPIIVLAILQQLLLIPMMMGVGGIIISLLMILVMSFLFTAVIYTFMGNMFRMAAMAISGIKPSPGEMLKFGNNFGNVFTAALISAVIIAIGSALCYLPGIIAGGLLMFAIPIAVDKRIAGGQAVSMSIDMLKKDVVMATLFYLVLSIVAGLGGVLCGIGIILTLPVLPVALAFLYRDYSGGFTYATEPVA